MAINLYCIHEVTETDQSRKYNQTTATKAIKLPPLHFTMYLLVFTYVPTNTPFFLPFFQILRQKREGQVTELHQ